MAKTVRIILICLAVLLLCSQLLSEKTLRNRNILILCAMSPGTPAYRYIVDNIRSEIVKAYGDEFYLHMEYLETERYSRGEYPKERFDLYNQKYEDVSLDLLICIGIDIIDPVKKNASDKILNLPTITIDFNMPQYGQELDLLLNERTTALGMKLKIPETLNTALNLFPGRDSVLFICGNSNADHLYLIATQAALREFEKEKKLSYITDISMDEALRHVRNLSDRYIVVIPGFNVDRLGVPYYNPEAIRLISQNSRVPVFAYSNMGFGDGMVGGYLMNFNKIGSIAGKAAIKILKGADPASIIISNDEFYEYMFDWRQLERWDLLDSEMIPEGSTVVYRDVNFLRKYRIYIIAVVLFLILQTLLILKLYWSNRKQRQVTMQLIETENKFRELVNEDRIQRLGQLSASLSHELNQPLTAILLTAQAGVRFLDSSQNDPGLFKELFQNIVEDDKRAASILSSIRGMLKLEKREKERTDLNTLIEEVITIYNADAIRKNITLELSLAPLPVYIVADRIQIQQVIMNLILNAIQSCEDSGEKSQKIQVTDKTEGSFVTVSVRDHGKGIAESVRDKLFRPFVTSRKEGSGIGLAISRSIIEDHQGRIWAENLPDGGALFSFSLKIYDDEKLV